MLDVGQTKCTNGPGSGAVTSTGLGQS